VLKGLNLLIGAGILAGCASSPPLPPVPASSYADAGPSSPATVRSPSACDSALNQGTKLRRVDLSQVAAIFRDANLKKSEFDTTEAFNKRAASYLNKVAALAKAAGHNDLVFDVAIPEDRLTYTADTKMMRVGEEYRGLLDTSNGKILVKKISRENGTYVGENAFGAKRQIVRLQEVELVIAPAEAEASYLSTWPNSFNPIPISMPPEEARKAKGSLSVLFAANLRSPYYETAKRRFSPKIDAPYDVTTASEILHVNLSGAVVFNRATGTSVAVLAI
jgi:hypothetical protein